MKEKKESASLFSNIFNIPIKECSKLIEENNLEKEVEFTWKNSFKSNFCCRWKKVINTHRKKVLSMCFGFLFDPYMVYNLSYVTKMIQKGIL